MAPKNDDKEPLRRCSICDDLHPGRGMFNHVRLSDNEDHGPRGTVPDGFSVDDCPIVGEVEVKLNRKDGYQSDHTRYVCNHCGLVCRGKSGLGVHLRRKAGRGLHPNANPDDELEYEQHTKFPVTESGEILVPRRKWADMVTLTEDEIRDGMAICVDEEMVESSEAVEVEEVSDDWEEILEEIRQEFKEYLSRGEDIAPATAYKEVEKRLKPSHEVQPA